MIRAVLFDFDGVLVDSESLHHEAWSDAVRPYGARVGWPEYQRRFVGKTDVWAGRTLLSKAGRKPAAPLVREVCERKHRYFRERAPETLNVAKEIVKWIANRLRNQLLGVVSSSPAIDVEPILEKAGLIGRLDVTVYGEHVRRHKPDPEAYLVAIERLRALKSGLDAAECIAFEDSDSGVAAASAAGLIVHRIASPAELLPALQQRFARPNR